MLARVTGKGGVLQIAPPQAGAGNPLPVSEFANAAWIGNMVGYGQIHVAQLRVVRLDRCLFRLNVAAKAGGEPQTPRDHYCLYLQR